MGQVAYSFWCRDQDISLLSGTEVMAEKSPREGPWTRSRTLEELRSAKEVTDVGKSDPFDMSELSQSLPQVRQDAAPVNTQASAKTPAMGEPDRAGDASKADGPATQNDLTSPSMRNREERALGSESLNIPVESEGSAGEPEGLAVEHGLRTSASAKPEGDPATGLRQDRQRVHEQEGKSTESKDTAELSKDPRDSDSSPRSSVLQWAETGLQEAHDRTLGAQGSSRLPSSHKRSLPTPPKRQSVTPMTAARLRAQCLANIVEGRCSQEEISVYLRTWRFTEADFEKAMPSETSLPNESDNSAELTQPSVYGMATPMTTTHAHGKASDGLGPPKHMSTAKRDGVDNTGYMWDHPFEGARPRTRVRYGLEPPALATQRPKEKVEADVLRGKMPIEPAPQVQLQPVKVLPPPDERVDDLVRRMNDVENRAYSAHVDVRKLEESVKAIDKRLQGRLDKAEADIQTLGNQIREGHDEIMNILTELMSRQRAAEPAASQPQAKEEPRSLDETGAVGGKAVPNCPRYSELYPPHAFARGPAGGQKLETGAALEPVTEHKLDLDESVETHESRHAVEETGISGPVSAPAAVGSNHPAPFRRPQSGVPLIGNKLVHEFVGKFGDESGDKSLRQFRDKIDDLASDMAWDDAMTGRAAKACLTGRALDVVLELQGQPGAYNWSNIQRVLAQEFYSQAARTSAEVKLENARREVNETVRKFANRVERLSNVAFNESDKATRDYEACRAFLRGANHPEMVIHLREKYESLTGVTLRRLIGTAEAYLSLRGGGVQPATQPTVATVAGGDGQGDQSRPSNPNPNAKKQKGKGKKKGPKPVAKTGNQSQSSGTADLLQQLAQVLQQNISKAVSPQDNCRGRCWKCGQLGHRKAECPGKGICAHVGVTEAPCTRNAGQTCGCSCSEHEHFGYGRCAAPE